MDQDGLDPRRVLEALGLPDATVLGRAAGGSDTAVWRIVRAGATYALRVFRPLEESDCLREIAVMRAAAEHGVPVPRVHVSGTALGRPAMVLDWVPGQTVVEALLEDPSRVERLGVQFGRAQAAIHATPAPRELLDAATDWIAWAGPAQAALRAPLRAAGLANSRLLHLDYHPLNVMTDGETITAVLDWANARAGDPRADFARTYTILRLDNGGLDREPEGRRLVRAFAHAWRRGYSEAAGPVERLAPFLAWAGQTMLRDLAPKRTSEQLAPARRWTARWERRV
jgi:aminoglycoside phosphotransferase (APT) family kinase protein